MEPELVRFARRGLFTVPALRNNWSAISAGSRLGRRVGAGSQEFLTITLRHVIYYLVTISKPAGRPRDPAVTAAILAAARGLVMELGYGAVTVEAIAQRAGVGRPTVYRRWSSKADLVFDALFEATETVDFPDTGNLIGDLAAIGHVIGADLSSPAAAQALVAVMAEMGDGGEPADRIRNDAIKPRSVEVSSVVARAQERGKARRDVDPVMVIHALAGVLYYHAAVLGDPVTDELIGDVVDLLVGGLSPSPTISR